MLNNVKFGAKHGIVTLVLVILQKMLPTNSDKGDGSDETIIYDASEYDESNKATHKLDKKHIEEGEKSPKGQLQTQTYGIIK